MDNNILLRILSHRPEVYEKSTEKFWDDAHISKGMLKAHLDPEMDAATRKPDFVRRSVGWIAEAVEEKDHPRLLDLGCGPGIYAELLAKTGFDVTGIDISERSIDYARSQSAQTGSTINYICGNYLSIDYDGVYDAVTLIYCDFGVLNPEERKLLLKKVHQALKPGGLLIFDVCSLKLYENRAETASWSYSDGGYWSEEGYICLHSFLRYDTSSSYADRYVIIEEDKIRYFNVWNHRFSAEEAERDLIEAKFSEVQLYANVAGDDYSDTSDTICAVARK